MAKKKQTNLQVILNGRTIIEKTAKEAYLKTFDELFKNKLIEPEKFLNDFNNIVRSNRNDWGDNDRYKRAKLISNSKNLYITTHSSTEAKINQLNSVFKNYNIDGRASILDSNKTIPTLQNTTRKDKKSVKNKLSQAICVTGESGAGKSYRVNKTLEKENHKTLFIILDSMWQHILFDYSPNDRSYCLTKVGKFIKEASKDTENYYTIVIDECHNNLEIINDSLLQAISTRRNDGLRFISLNSLVDQHFSFLSEFKGNRVLPDNLGFLFISSKSDIIEGNADLNNRIDIVELDINDQSEKDFSIDFLLSKLKKEEESDYTN